MTAPGYIALANDGTIRQRIDAAYEMISPQCRLCPRECAVDRRRGDVGFCRTSSRPIVSSLGPHFGEEPPLVGTRGSGTIFFTHCNLGCAFCQNYDISHGGAGREITAAELSDMMLQLQALGCHNINLVTPTHQVPTILEALEIAAASGLSIPLVYNCGGHESVETLRLLDGIVDIYMPDLKYGNNDAGLEYSGVPDYWDRVREAIREMHRQVGDLTLDERGIAVRGLIVRFLVLPEGKAGDAAVARFLAEEIGADTYVNVMDQYHPAHRASEYPVLARPITPGEFRNAVETMRRAGLRRLE